MTKIVVKRNGLKHEAIQSLGLFGSDKAGDMHGIKGVSYQPRWVRSSWNGFQFELFSIYLSDEAIAKVEAYCERYAA